MRAMRDEMARSLSMQLPGLAKPYFIADRIQDVNDTSISATLGGLLTSRRTRSRVLHVELRAGDYKLDNSNFLALGPFGAGSVSFGASQQITLDDDYQEIRRRIWLATDSEYKRALQQFAAKQAALQSQTRGDNLPDFSQEKPNQYFEPAKVTPADTAQLEGVARAVSAVFRQMPELQTSSVTVNAHNVYTRYLNSEGTEYKRSNAWVSVELKAIAQAEDGIPIDDTEQVLFGSPTEIVTADLAARAARMVQRMQKLCAAATLERYNGPVLFENEAGAEVFAQLFAPGLVASRSPMTDNPQAQAFLEQMSSRFGGGSLADKIGGRVLPEFVDIEDNPLLNDFHGRRLLGSYHIDDDGVPSRQNRVVEAGVLKLLLASRTPTSEAPQSTGSHRGLSASLSNLIFTAKKSSSDQELRRMLLERAKARGSDYGIVVRRAGGSINEFIQSAMSMARGGGPAGNNMVEVFKVYADGREELIHGVQLPSSSPLAFKDIIAVGDNPVVHDTFFIPGFTSLMMLGLSGDFSSVLDMPVMSYVVPSLLFDEATLKKASGPFPKPPVSAPPVLNPAGQ